MPIFEFWWDGGEETSIMQIEADKKTVEKLLDEYRKSDPENYNIEEWCEFLNEKGIKASFIYPEFSFYF